MQALYSTPAPLGTAEHCQKRMSAKSVKSFALSLSKLFLNSHFHLFESLDRRGVWRWAVQFCADFCI